MEACFVEKSDYQLCDTPGRAEHDPQLLRHGNHAGQAETVGAGEDSYTVIAHSRSGADFQSSRPVASALSAPAARVTAAVRTTAPGSPAARWGADPRTTVQNR